MSDSLWPHGIQHARFLCPFLSPGVCSNSCPLSWWFHPTISSSVVPFSSHHQSFSESASFPMSQLAKVLELQLQSFQWIFRVDFLWDGLVGSPCSPRESHESSPTLQFESINFSVLSLLYGPALYMTTGKTLALTRQTFVGKVRTLFLICCLGLTYNR